MLQDLRALLGFYDVDKVRDAKLELLLSFAQKQLQVRLGGIEPPTELKYIVIEVAVKRFNRIGSEGFDSHTVEGESITLNDKDFDSFENDIQAWLDAQKESTRGKVRFL